MDKQAGECSTVSQYAVIVKKRGILSISDSLFLIFQILIFE